jgi:DNA-binding CsgD family transcriptional regulator
MGIRKNSTDLVRILEATYEVDQPREDWLRGVMHAAQQPLGQRAGIAGVLYDVSEETLRTEAMLGLDLAPGWLEMGAEMHGSPALAPGIAEGYRKVLCGTLQMPTLDAVTTEQVYRYYRRFGYEDGIYLNGMDTSGVGSALFWFSSTQVALSTRARAILSRVATHLATGYRLQRRLAEGSGARAPVEAILKPSGKVDHAERAAQSKESRSSLTEAVKLREWARGRARRDDARAVSAWQGLVTARWTLVDTFESEGRRYVHAHENAPVVPSPEALSIRERQVASLAALGRSNKLIAYELGLAHSTVRVLLSRAAAKLGVASRSDLVRLWQGSTRPA